MHGSRSKDARMPSSPRSTNLPFENLAPYSTCTSVDDDTHVHVYMNV